jgi:penicillin amidase
LYDTLPAALVDFLVPAGTEFDAPLVGEPLQIPIPGPEVLDLRKTPPAPALPKAAALRSPLESRDLAAAVGSNNWAVAGSHTANGRGLLANDMHLGIRVPNTWYRASLLWPDGQGGTRRVTGVTLPGAPLVTVGSNGQVAWGFTNSYGDWSDLIVLDPAPNDPGSYLTPAGPKKLERFTETIHVKGGQDATEEVEQTIWGPVIRKDTKGRRLAMAWTAHDPQAVNLRIQELEMAGNLDEALAVAHRSGIPAQNFVVADASGRIGWTVVGQVPRRVGFDGRRPTSWADGSRRWDGWLAPEEVPQVVDPAAGRVWTANSRVVDGDALAKLGDGGYAFGARSRQIRDDLMGVEKATPADMLKIQLDDRALFLSPWRDLLLRTLTPEAVKDHPRRAELKKIVETTWTGRASVDSAAYRVVRFFKQTLSDQIFASLVGPCQAADAELCFPSIQLQGQIWKLVNERPAHLLDPRYKSWDEAILASIDSSLDFYQKQGTPLNVPWGVRNTSVIQHPLSQAVPFLARFLDVPPHQLPGDENMPRVQGVFFGASERLAVSPGEEEKGYFHMPVGQSGHPMSPYYQKGHEAWMKGEPTPFLPGPAQHTLKLVPAG